MPKAIGSPIPGTTFQPQREVSRFQVDVTYDTSGVPHFTFSAFGILNTRDASGNILATNPTYIPIVTQPDASVGTAERNVFTQICTLLDTL